MSRAGRIIERLDWKNGDTTVLYHVTTPWNAVNILKEDKLRGGFRGTGKIASLTNSPHYWLPGGIKIIRFVLDGEKLAQAYPIVPFTNKPYLKKTKVKSEYEFRVRGPVENFHSFVTRIDIRRRKAQYDRQTEAEIDALVHQTDIPVRRIGG